MTVILQRIFDRYPAASLALYCGLILAFGATVWFSVTSVLDERTNLAASQDILQQIERRRPAADAAGGPAGAIPAGSPFLGGETITVGGAALLQRVAGSITRLGGSIQSSQVDVQGPRSKDGYITLLINCELEQASLQKLLYDLEAGMPFLFVDQLVVTPSQDSGNERTMRLRLLIAVTGQWRGRS